MTSSNCYSSLYPFPIDLNEDDPLQHQTQQLFSFENQFSSPSSSSSSSTSSSSSLTRRVSINPAVQDQEEEKIFVPRDGPLKNDRETKLSIWRNEERHENISSAKWMPSKMRILRKMMSSDQPKSEDHQHPPSSSPHNNNIYNNTIRVCSDCNTTKTPLWRSGPRGPKSLCNACGIRQRKARRAMAAAAANETVVAAETTTKTSKVQYKAKRSSNNCVPRFKNKKCELNSQTQTRNKLCFEELRIMLSKNSAFHQVFPQDEKEAAILLMALSYGLAVHG